jgi:AcrR family transcriptional regulator
MVTVKVHMGHSLESYVYNCSCSVCEGYLATKVANRKASLRRRPSQRRSRETFEAVLDAVGRILKREGLKAVTTNRVAEVAGVSIGSVYQYFPDKQSIFVALHARHVAEIDSVIHAALLENASAPLDSLMRALIEAMVKAHAPDPALYELMFTEVPHRAEGTREFAVRLHGAFRLAIAARMYTLQTDEDLDRVAFVVAHMVDSLGHGIVLRRPEGLSLSDATDEVVRAVNAYLHSYGHKDGRRASRS